ncbi:MAG: hypothetical protein P8M11_12010 [Planctomycetota bacterium]|nr:hypothetical protein [Planctomycetota bacterium]MDG1985285.1 hypothetical protein [Planctomycetota bacterium]
MSTPAALHLRRLAPLLMAISVLPGCFFSRSRTNPELSPELASQIIPNQSTAGDVTRVLGAPNEVVQLGLRTAWRYEHTVEKQSAAFLVFLGLRGVDTQSDRVWVFFDTDGNVTNVGTQFQASEAEYDVPIF